MADRVSATAPEGQAKSPSVFGFAEGASLAFASAVPRRCVKARSLPASRSDQTRSQERHALNASLKKTPLFLLHRRLANRRQDGTKHNMKELKPSSFLNSPAAMVDALHLGQRSFSIAMAPRPMAARMGDQRTFRSRSWLDSIKSNGGSGGSAAGQRTSAACYSSLPHGIDIGTGEPGLLEASKKKSGRRRRRVSKPSWLSPSSSMNHSASSSVGPSGFLV